MKTLVSTFLMLVLGVCSLFGAETGITSGSTPSSTTTILSSVAPESDGDFDDFEIEVEPNRVGNTAAYSLEFEINNVRYLELKIGLLSFDFPDHTDLTNVSVTSFEDDSEWFDFHVVSVSSVGTRLTLEVKKHKPKSSEHKKCKSVEFEIELTGIVNSTIAGEHRLAALAAKQNGEILAGPTLSDSFELKPGSLAQLSIDPDKDMILQAGDAVAFEVHGVDQYGNEVDEVDATFSLTDGSDPIGHFTGSIFHARTVGSGYVLAEAGGLTVTSGRITVVHGEFANIELNVETDQVVRIPLFGVVNAVLMDAYGNRVTDYDLSVNPLRLSLLSNTGSFSPSVISDNSTLTDGLIDITLANVVSTAPSIVTEMIVFSGIIHSNRVPITFSGYNILEVLDETGNPLTDLVEATHSIANIVVVNNGPLVPIRDVALMSSIASTHYVRDTTFVGSSNGRIDTITVGVPPSAQFISKDTVTIVLASTFESDNTLTTFVSSRTIVEIIPKSLLTFDTGSFLPDSIYPGVGFDISFSLLSDGITGPFDSTRMTISLLDSIGFGYDAALLSAKVGPTSFAGGRISYSGLKGTLMAAEDFQGGFYYVHIATIVRANGIDYRLVDPVIDSIFVHDRTVLSYQDNSLQPKVTAVNEPTVVSFTIDVDSDQPLDMDVVQSTVTLRGDAFSTTVNIDPQTVQLTPGSNEIRSQPLYIPPSQLGQLLTTDINISYLLTPGGQAAIFTSDANGETIFVQDRPVLRINSLVTEVFNGDHVNTGQSFKIVAAVENLSTEIVRNVSTSLSSDGLSQYVPLAMTDSIMPGAVAEITWDIIASSQPTYAEVFTVRIDNDDVGQMPPLDNVTLAIIESPANLVLTYELYGVIGDLVDQEAHFVLIIEMLNNGDAEVEIGQYLLTTGGVDFGPGDSVRGDIEVREHLMYEFTAPSFDTNVAIAFDMTQVPIDRNTGSQSIMDSISFSFDIRVQSLASDLVADAELLGTNLVTPGNPKRMYRLRLTNQSDILDDHVELKEITMGLHLDDNTRPGTDEIINSQLSIFTQDGLVLPVSFTGGDVLTAHFENLIILAGQQIVLEFVPMISQQLNQSFSLTLETGDIVLEKTEGPQAGQRVPVSTPGGNRFLISQTYISRGEDLLESFIIERNPFNPDDGEVTFGYRLDRPSAVNFRVYTLIGEEVYATTIGINDAGGQVGEHEVAWDGRNSDGNMVYSGVYVAILEVLATGEKARLKVAVMR